MNIHVVGGIGLVIVFLVGTLRPINLGALGLVMTFLVGTIVAGESAREMYGGFPVDLLVLLVGVTYLFGIATTNGTVALVVNGAAGLVKDRPALVPWVVFVAASLPAMAGALGSAGVAMLAPIALRLASRYEIDRRLIGLMVVHGAAAGNFSPLNVLGAMRQAVSSRGLEMSPSALFFANLAYNIILVMILTAVFRRPQPCEATVQGPTLAARAAPAGAPQRPTVAQLCSMMALAVVATGAIVFDLNIGLLALTAAAALHLSFPASSRDADKRIAWSVVLLVCGIVTYVTALQRYGTVEAVGSGIAAVSTPLVTALVLAALGAVTSAFASSAGILGALIPLATPLMIQGQIDATWLVVALAISSTVVDSTPFSTVGALVVANAEEHERVWVYRGLLWWGMVMVATAPVITWLIFVLPAST